MKKILFVLSLGVFISPAFALAHGMMNFSNTETPYQMMQYLGEKTLGSEIYAEAEELMVKMMTGDLTEAEADRMVEIMNQYPGPMGMMMGSSFGMMNGYGIKGGYYPQDNYGENPWIPHMGYWGGNSFGIRSWIDSLMHIIWLLISILVLVWLWQKVAGKK